MMMMIMMMVMMTTAMTMMTEMPLNTDAAMLSNSKVAHLLRYTGDFFGSKIVVHLVRRPT